MNRDENLQTLLIASYVFAATTSSAATSVDVDAMPVWSYYYYYYYLFAFSNGVEWKQRVVVTVINTSNDNK